MRWNGVVVLMGAVALAGCTNPSDVQALRKEISPLDIGPALTPQGAFKRLESKGFKCSAPMGGDGYYGCSRDRNYFILSTCVQRVEFYASAPDKAIRSVEPPRIFCGGM